MITRRSMFAAFAAIPLVPIARAIPAAAAVPEETGGFVVPSEVWSESLSKVRGFCLLSADEIRAMEDLPVRLIDGEPSEDFFASGNAAIPPSGVVTTSEDGESGDSVKGPTLAESPGNSRSAQP